MLEKRDEWAVVFARASGRALSLHQLVGLLFPAPLPTCCLPESLPSTETVTEQGISWGLQAGRDLANRSLILFGYSVAKCFLGQPALFPDTDVCPHWLKLNVVISFLGQ